MQFLGEIYFKDDNPYVYSTRYACDMKMENTPRHKQLVIEPTEKGGVARFLAHGDNPNCKMVTIIAFGELHNVVVATKHIESGTELIWHYGEEFGKMGINVCLCFSKFPKCNDYRAAMMKLIEWLYNQMMKQICISYTTNKTKPKVQLLPLTDSRENQIHQRSPPTVGDGQVPCSSKQMVQEMSKCTLEDPQLPELEDLDLGPDETLSSEEEIEEAFILPNPPVNLSKRKRESKEMSLNSSGSSGKSPPKKFPKLPTLIISSRRSFIKLKTPPITQFKPARAKTHVSDGPDRPRGRPRVRSPTPPGLVQRGRGRPKTTALIELRCPKCDKEIKGHRGNLNKHLKTHDQNEAHECTICKKKMKTQRLLRRHISIHFGKKHRCPGCGKMFSRKEEVKNHQKRREGKCSGEAEEVGPDDHEHDSNTVEDK